MSNGNCFDCITYFQRFFVLLYNPKRLLLSSILSRRQDKRKRHNPFLQVHLMLSFGIYLSVFDKLSICVTFHNIKAFIYLLIPLCTFYIDKIRIRTNITCIFFLAVVKLSGNNWVFSLTLLFLTFNTFSKGNKTIIFTMN